MNNNNILTPALRFPGFSGDWSVKLVKDFCDINTGKSNTQDQVEDGKYPFYIRSAMPVRSNRYLYDCEAVITIGDGQIGKVFHYVNGKFDLHQRCYMMSNFKGINPRYFYYFFSGNFYERAMRLTAKATVDSVRLEMISDMPIFIPPTYEEQNAIASLLSELDHLISAQEQKVESLKAYKKGLTQQFLPKPGKTTPRLRFPGFTGEWQEKKLNEVFARVARKNGEDNQNVLTISAQYGLISQLDFFKKPVASSDVTGYYLLHKGEFAYNKSSSQGRPVGAIKPLRLYDKGVVSTLYICFKCNDSEAVDFWEQYFDAGILDREILSIAQEGARNHGLLNIPTGDFFGLKVIHPTLPEMKKIAECLSALDDTIAAEQNKLNTLIAHKKGLMQQLFPQTSK